MSSPDQLEIINAQGEVRFHGLQGGRGITNIGRHPDNDIVLDSPAVAPFHAILDHQNKPYRIIALSPESAVKVSGEVLRPNVPRELRNWDTIELDGCSIVLMEAGPAAGSPAPSIAPAPLPPQALPSGEPGLPPSPEAAADPIGPAAEPAHALSEMEELDRLLAMLPEDQSDEYILVETLAQNGALDPAHPASLDFTVDVEQPATMQINITNGGPLVGEFTVEVRGLDPSWVSIQPESLNLRDGGTGHASIAIAAPRLASSRAKAHYFSVIVSSPTYPGRITSVAGLLILKPFYEYAVGDVDPKKQKIPYSKKVGQALFPVTNLGNAPMEFQIQGEDEKHAANIEFDSPEEGLKLANQIRVTVQAEETLAVPVFITPRKPRFIGIGGENIQYTLTVTPVTGGQQTPRSVLAEASARPFMGPLPLVLLGLLLLLLTALVFTPRILAFETDANAVIAGQSATLRWQTTAFTTLTLDPGDGEPVPGPNGSVSVEPVNDTAYTLVAETWPAILLPQWFRVKSDPIIIQVTPVLPEIAHFEPDAYEILLGEGVIVSWDVNNADTLNLSVNDANETIAADQATGSRTYNLTRDTVFTLRAANEYTGAEGKTESFTVRVGRPDPTPPPDPIIQQFDVSPQSITAGEEISITWVVLNAEKITIDGVEGQFPPNGSVTVRPAADTNYVITASNGVVEKKSSIQVFVLPAPTPTPDPLAPKIESFQASPAEVDIGSAEAKNIELSWSIAGDVTGVEITGPNAIKYTGLPAKGSIRVATDQAALYVLTAFNGSLRSSQTTQIKVKNPLPKITAINPASSTDVGGASLSLVVTGSGFVKDSKVQVAGSNRTTAFISSTQLSASLITEDLTKANNLEVKVFNPSPGGGSSAVVIFTLNNPVPSLASISPASITKGASGLTLTVSGSNFVNGSKVRWGGAEAPTTYVSSSQLTAQITATQLENAGTVAVSVFNPTPGGGTSGTVTFTINAQNPVPVVNALSAPTPGLQPSSAMVGADSGHIVVNGSNFIPGTLVRWKGTFLTTIYVSDTQLEADIPPEKLAAFGSANITAFNPAPGGGVSAPQVFTVTALGLDIKPAASILGVTFVSANGTVKLTAEIAEDQTSDLEVTLTSGNLAYVTLHPWTGATCDTLTAIGTVTIPAGATAADFCILGAAPGLTSVTAKLPDSVGGETKARSVAVTASPPTISALQVPAAAAGSPAPGVGVGSSSFELVITGSGFINGAKVNWPGQISQTAIFIDSTQLRFLVPASYLTSTGTKSVTVTNPATVDPSNSILFNINAPVLNTISPGSATAGTSLPDAGAPCPAGYNLRVTGQNFVNSSIVRWASSDRTTAFVDSQNLCAQIPSADLVSSGSVLVRVRNGAFFTTSSSFTIGVPSLAFSIEPGSVTVGATAAFQVTLSPLQSVARTVNLSAVNASNVVLLDVTCTTVITQINIPAMTANGSFCVRGANAASVTVTATMAAFSSATDSSILTVNAAGTSLTVIKESPASPKTAESVRLTATLTSGGGVPTGTVTFSDTLDGTLCANVAVNASGKAVCDTTDLKSHNGASHTITATYTSNSGNFTNTSNTVAFTVAKANVTVGLAQSLATSAYGQTTTLTATLTAEHGGLLTGSVVFKAGGTTFITQSISGHPSGNDVVVAFSTELNASPSAYSLTAEYQDSTTHFNNGASSGLNHTVNRAATTATVEKQSPIGSIVTGHNPVVFKGSLAANSPSTATVTGTVDFEIDNVVVCDDVPLDSHGDATCTVTSASQFRAALSPYNVEVVYAQTTNFNADTHSLSQAVGEATPTVAVSKIDPAGNPVTGQEFDLRATVGPQFAGAITPTGAVTFQRWSGFSWFNLAGCVNVALSSGQADCNNITGTATSSPSMFRVQYNSDANYIDGTSPTFDVTIDLAPTTTVVSSSDVDNATLYGQTFTLTATVTNTGSNVTTWPTGTVRFTANGATISGCGSQPVSMQSSTVGTATCSVRDQLPGSNSGTAYNLAAEYTSSPANYQDSSDSTPISHTVTNPTITLSPCPVSSASGASTVTLTVTISAAQSSNTTISLASNDTARVIVPATAIILAETTSITFLATEGSTTNGTATVTGTLPAGLGSGTSNGCSVSFTP